MLRLRLPTGTVRVDRHIVAVTHDSVEIGHSDGRRWHVEWVELELRSRTAPEGWPRAAWLELLELARDMRAPGYLERRRRSPPYWVDPIESRDPDTRSELLAVIARFEDEDEAVVRTYVGGPMNGQRCSNWMTSHPFETIDGITHRYDTTHLETARGQLVVHVYLGPSYGWV